MTFFFAGSIYVHTKRDRVVIEIARDDGTRHMVTMDDTDVNRIANAMGWQLCRYRGERMPMQTFKEYSAERGLDVLNPDTTETATTGSKSITFTNNWHTLVDVSPERVITRPAKPVNPPKLKPADETRPADINNRVVSALESAKSAKRKKAKKRDE